MAQTKYKRTQFIVKKGFQLRYISMILAIMLLSAVISGYTIYYNAWVYLGSKLASVYPQGRLVHMFRSINIKLAINLAFVAMLCTGIGIIVSHRIAGPIDRMIKFVNKLTAGDYSRRLTLREKDELKDLASAINELVDKLEGQKKT